MNNQQKVDLCPLAYYIRKTLIEMNDLIQAYQLPYKIDLKFDMEHKNWEIISKLHGN